MIPVSDLKKGHLYRLTSRNLSFGVWDGKNGFIGIRTKFQDRYLDQEIHWDLSNHFGTAKPLEDLGMFCENPWYIGNTYDYITKRDVAFDRPVSEGGKGWYFLDTGESSEGIRPVSRSNRKLFTDLDEFLKRSSGEV